MTKKKDDTTSPFPHKMRDNIEAAAMAILMAVGLKYFLVEAYEIPTPSMQPVLMGSKELAIYDRILVNKAAYLAREPQRWDIAVFHYPHNQSQNYVKRIVGMPGEELQIIQGDVYRLRRDGNKPPAFEILRKPAALQEHLWKLMWEQSDGEHLEHTFHFNRSRGIWKVDGNTVIADGTRDLARTLCMPPDEPRDHYWHGYPEWLHEKLERGGGAIGHNPIGDLRWRITAVPRGELRSLALWHTQRTASGRERAFCLRIESAGGGNGSATLEYYEDAKRLGGNGATAPAEVTKLDTVALGRGQALALELTHYDHRIAASVGGRSLEAIEYVVRPERLEWIEQAIECRGEVALQDGSLERDLFYEPNRSEAPDFTYRVPEGHHWMLGDNTKKSDDGRSWRAMRIWVTGNGKLAPPGQGRALDGNLRYFYDTMPNALDPDENPVVVPGTGKLVFTDKFGEEHVIDASHHDLESRLADYAFTDGSVRFVPRRFMVGRAFATFWPANPFGWFRVGLIR